MTFANIVRQLFRVESRRSKEKSSQHRGLRRNKSAIETLEWIEDSSTDLLSAFAYGNEVVKRFRPDREEIPIDKPPTSFAMLQLSRLKALLAAGQATRFSSRIRSSSWPTRSARGRRLHLECFENRVVFAVAGGLDPTFGIGGLVTTDFSDNSIDLGAAIVVQADGKMVVAGNSDQGSATRWDIAAARYNADGSLDLSFGVGGKVLIDLGSTSEYIHNDFISGVAVQADGKIVMAGNTQQVTTSYVPVYDDSGFLLDYEAQYSYSFDVAVIRLNADGSLDSSFGTNGKQTIDFGTTGEEACAAMAVGADGKIILAGYITQGVTGYDFAIARLNSDGTLDSSFDGDGKQTVDFGFDEGGLSMAIQADGKIVVAGNSVNQAQGTVMVRLNDDGTLDSTFDDDGKLKIADDLLGYAVAAQTDGKLVLAGYSDQGVNLHDFTVARVNADGSLDDTFNSNGKQSVDFGSPSNATSIAVQSDGKIVATGLSDPGNSADFAVARLNVDGSLDNSFDGDGRQTIDFGSNYDLPQKVALQADGKIVVAGFSSQDFAVTRLLGITDTDDDGIEDTIDTQPMTFSDDFSDGTTSGTIANRGDQNITIVDSPNSADGVRITADFLGGAEPATIDIVGGASTLTLSAGDQVTVTHGSVIVDVLAGIVEATFVADAGGTATASLSSGNGLVFKPESFTFIAPTTNSEVVQAMFPTESGQTVTLGLASGNSVLFQPDTATFVAPATNTQPLEIVSDGTVLTVEPGGSVAAGNSSPTAAVSGPTNGVRGQRRTLTLGAIDSPADVASGFTYRIDWDGDGLPDETVTGPVGTAVDHVFTESGSYQVGVTATDNAGAESPIVTHSFTIGIAQLQVDPLDPGGHILAVGGGMGADKIHIEIADDGDDDADQFDAYEVKVQDRVEGRFKYRDSFSPPPEITRIVVFAQAGDDNFQVAGDIDVTVEVHGGAGNDRIKGGRGDDLLFGDEGDDLVVGGQGRDLLNGGLGADRIVGNSDDDILIAGTTDFDSSEAALRAVMAEWTSDRSYATRVANLAGTGSGGSFSARFNENWFLNDITVHDDGAQDLLSGDGGRDWFFLNLVLDPNDDAAKKDKATDLGAQEFALDLDFIVSP